MRKLTVLLVLSALLAACSPYALVNSSTYNDADLSDYRTFRIVTPGDGHLPPGMEYVTYYNIAAAIREQMLERGYVESPKSPLVINIGVTIQKELATQPAFSPGFGPYPGPYFSGCYPCFIYPRPNYWSGYYANAQVVTGMYKEGVLTMDMVNIDKKVPLYSASVATIMNRSNGRFRDLKGIAEAVQTLFSRFPVKVLPQYAMAD